VTFVSTHPIQHRISFISFKDDVVVCTCGAETRATREAFANHRVEMKVRLGNLDIGHDHTGAKGREMYPQHNGR